MRATDKTVQEILKRLRDEAAKNGVSVWASDIEPWPEAVPITAAAVSVADQRHGGSGLETWVTFRDAKTHVGMLFVEANDSGICEHLLDRETLVPAAEAADRAVEFLTAQIRKMAEPPRPPVILPPPPPSPYLAVPTEDLSKTLWNDGKET